MPTPDSMKEKAMEVFGGQNNVDIDTKALNIKLIIALLSTCVVFFATEAVPMPAVALLIGLVQLFFLFGDSAPADQFSVRVNQNSTWQSPVQNNSALSTGVWYNMCVTYNSSSGYILYQNGTSVDTSNTTGSITVSGSGSAIIGALSTTSRFYDGKISQTLLYNKALTAAEVQQNYNSLKERYGL